MIIDCDKIISESERLRKYFIKCYDLKASDMREIIDLIESVSVCSGGTLEFKTINGQSIIGTGNIEIDTTADGTETKIIAGEDILITGTGASSNPYIISNIALKPDGSETKIIGGDNVSILGSGTISLPYVVNLNLPAFEQVNSDWAATSGKAQILNKPEIPAAQVNADWNATSGVAQILNKPNLSNTDLNYIASDSQGEITSSNGSSAIIPIVDETNAGLMSPELLESVNLSSDNIKREIIIDIPSNYSNQDFADVINALENFEIEANEIVTFKAIRVINETLSYIYYVEMIGVGKGEYGVGGHQLEAFEVKVTSFVLSSNDLESDESTQVIDLGTNVGDVLNSINTSIPNLLIQDQSEGYVLIKGTFNGKYQEFLWIGPGGIYGGELGADQATTDDLTEITQSGNALRATSTISGTVRTDLTVDDPQVYLKQTTDSLLLLKENLNNKQNSLVIDGTGVKYPTVDAVNAGLISFTTPDATTTVKGKLRLAGDLGGTADLPTTPTAVHLAGNETITGNKIITGTLSVQTPIASDHAVTKAYADGLVVGLLDDRGSYNASTNLFPTTRGSGTSGAILKGDLWYVSVAGTLGGKAVNIGDSFRALVDAPGQVSGNWSILSSNLGYAPENIANKQNSLTVDVTNTKYPTVTAVNLGLSLKANDTDVVHKTGTETITGSKSFDTTSGSTASLNATVSGTGTVAATINALNSGVGLIVSGFNAFNRNIATFSNYGTLTSASIVTIRNESGSVNSDFLTCSNPTIGTVSRINKTGDITGNSFVKTGGLGTEYLKADGSVSTLTNPITGTGASGQISYFNGVSSQAGNANFIWDNTNGRLGLGTPSPTSKLHLIVPNEDGISVESSNRGLIEIRKTGGARWRFQNDLNLANGLELLYGNNITPTQSVMAFSSAGNVGIGTSNTSTILTLNNSTGAQISYRKNDINKWIFGMDSGESTENFNLYNYNTSSVNLSVNQTSGNVLIGTTTDNGSKLQVNGTISTTGVSIINSDAISSSPDVIFSNVGALSSQITTLASNIDIGFGTADSIIESFHYTSIGYGIQRITYTSGTLINRVFIRSVNGGSWSGWVEK